MDLWTDRGDPGRSGLDDPNRERRTMVGTLTHSVHAASGRTLTAAPREQAQNDNHRRRLGHRLFIVGIAKVLGVDRKAEQSDEFGLARRDMIVVGVLGVTAWASVSACL